MGYQTLCIQAQGRRPRRFQDFQVSWVVRSENRRSIGFCGPRFRRDRCQNRALWLSWARMAQFQNPAVNGAVNRDRGHSYLTRGGGGCHAPDSKRLLLQVHSREGGNPEGSPLGNPVTGDWAPICKFISEIVTSITRTVARPNIRLLYSPPLTSGRYQMVKSLLDSLCARDTPARAGPLK